MNPQRLKSIIEKGEGIETEFKAASFELPKNIFETICAFLNRHGGHIILGVLNNGKVEGVLPEAIQSMKEAIVANVNNPQKLKPTFYLSIETIEIEGCPLVYVYVPESSQVHQTNGRIFDRNEDGDFDITDNPTLVRNLHIRKHQSYTENNIYPYLKLSDLREDLIQRSRTLAQNHHPGHFGRSWTMSNCCVRLVFIRWISNLERKVIHWRRRCCWERTLLSKTSFHTIKPMPSYG